jgi:hypothetical protein
VLNGRCQSSSVRPSIFSSQTYRPPGQRKRTDAECDHCVQRRAGQDAGRTTDLELAADLEGLRRGLRIRLERSLDAVFVEQRQLEGVATVRLVPGNLDLERDRARDRVWGR